jgi:hypothetical protein
VPATRIGRLALTPDLAQWQIGLEVWLDGEPRGDLRLNVKTAERHPPLLAADTYHGHQRRSASGRGVIGPGIDDSRNELLWSPHAPTLIDVELELWAERGELIDQVRSYTALRTVAAQGERFLLNGRPYLCCAWCWTRGAGPTAA